MSGRVYLLGVGLVLLAGALAVTHWAMGPWPAVTEANVRRIKPGMTLQEVEALLWPHCHQQWGGTGRDLYAWVGRDGCAFVYLDNQTRRVTADRAEHLGPDTQWAERTRRELGLTRDPGPLERLRAWLGW